MRNVIICLVLCINSGLWSRGLLSCEILMWAHSCDPEICGYET